MLNWCLFFLLLVLARPAIAAGLDCSRPHPEPDSTICQHDTLLMLDEQLGRAYHQARLRSPEPHFIQVAHSNWMRRTRANCGTDTACLERVYRLRLDELQNSNLTYSNLKTALERTCYEQAAYASLQSPTTCARLGTQTFKLNHLTLTALWTCLDKRYRRGDRCVSQGRSVFESQSEDGEAFRLYEHAGAAGLQFLPVQLVVIEGTPLLHIPVLQDGTGNFNDSTLLAYGPAGWTPVDREAWEASLHKHLPKGLSIQRGIWPDYTQQTAIIPLYTSKDPNCCPSGGSARVKIGLENGQLVTRSIEILPQDH